MIIRLCLICLSLFAKELLFCQFCNTDYINWQLLTQSICKINLLKFSIVYSFFSMQSDDMGSHIFFYYFPLDMVILSIWITVRSNCFCLYSTFGIFTYLLVCVWRERGWVVEHTMVFKVKTIAKIVSENSHHPYIPFPSSHSAYIYDTSLSLYPTKLLNFLFIIPELPFSWKYVHVCMFLATHFLLDKRLCTKPIWTFFFKLFIMLEYSWLTMVC